MITSKNEVFEGQFNNVFISWKSHFPFLTYSIFHILNHSINFESCDAMISISTRVRIFLIDLFNHELFGHEAWPTNKCCHGQRF